MVVVVLVVGVVVVVVIVVVVIVVVVVAVVVLLLRLVAIANSDDAGVLYDKYKIVNTTIVRDIEALDLPEKLAAELVAVKEFFINDDEGKSKWKIFKTTIGICTSCQALFRPLRDEK